MKKSAGILLYRKRAGHVEVLLVHPGGPFWKNRNENAWSIPKGEFTPDEDPLDAANREFTEETGIALSGDFRELKPVKQQSGKWVYAWAHENDLDAASIQSNVFEMEWPPKSGQLKRFPEIDKAEWFKPAEAKTRIISAQSTLIDQLMEMVE